MDILINQQLQSQYRKLQYRRKRYSLRTDAQIFEKVPDLAFEKLFRFAKPICKKLISEISPYLTSRRQCNGLTKEQRILCAIRFLATGSYQVPVGQDFLIAMSQSSVSRCISEVCSAIDANLGRKYICFPKTEQYNVNKEKFYRQHGMPGVIGLIDGTHICIKRPENEIEHCYYSVRKSQHTKNVQIICDSDYNIIYINAKFGGASHDSYIWNTSDAKTYLENEYANGSRNAWLLGDSGYGQSPWLMTPIRNETTSGEAAYNVAHKKTRSLIERCIGILKSRFRCLSKQRILMYSPEKSGCIINACAILHNFLQSQGYPYPSEREIDEEIEYDDQDIFVDYSSAEILREGVLERQRVVRNFFEN